MQIEVVASEKCADPGKALVQIDSRYVAHVEIDLPLLDPPRVAHPFSA